jgi:2-keto-4-pentenoate hydratase
MADEASTAHAVDTAAGRLRNAQALGAPCPPIRTLFDPDDIASAYRVQRANLALAAAAGRRRIGRKIGLTSPAVQRQLGVDQPDFGSLLEDIAVAPGDVPARGVTVRA